MKRQAKMNQTDSSTISRYSVQTKQANKVENGLHSLVLHQQQSSQTGIELNQYGSQ